MADFKSFLVIETQLSSFVGLLKNCLIPVNKTTNINSHKQTNKQTNKQNISQLRTSKLTRNIAIIIPQFNNSLSDNPLEVIAEMSVDCVPIHRPVDDLAGGVHVPRHRDQHGGLERTALTPQVTLIQVLHQ